MYDYNINIIILFSGLLAGLYAALWGTVKDVKVEGFRIFSFTRSLFLGGVSAILLILFLHYYPVYIALFIPFFICVALERQLTEAYKGFIRVEDQTKYRIPTYFSFYGRMIKGRIRRLLLGLVLLTIFFLVVFYIRWFLIISHIPLFLKIIIAGSVGGLYTSLGGANKDGPIEGFEKIKVWRSEIISVCFAFLFFPFVNDWALLGYASAGAERTVVEFYKTFIMKKRPGKFK